VTFWEVWFRGAKSGQYCVIGGWSLQKELMQRMIACQNRSSTEFPYLAAALPTHNCQHESEYACDFF
jgi:hypothetical protein